MCDFGTKSRERGRNVTVIDIDSLAGEAGFYGDTGRVIGFLTNLSNGCVTVVLDFVEDPVSRYLGGSGGMEDSVISVLRRYCPRICLVRRM